MCINTSVSTFVMLTFRRLDPHEEAIMMSIMQALLNKTVFSFLQTDIKMFRHRTQDLSRLSLTRDVLLQYPKGGFSGKDLDNSICLFIRFISTGERRMEKDGVSDVQGHLSESNRTSCQNQLTRSLNVHEKSPQKDMCEIKMQEMWRQLHYFLQVCVFTDNSTK